MKPKIILLIAAAAEGVIGQGHCRNGRVQMICDDTIPAGDGEPSDPADFRGRVITAVDAAGCGM